MDKPNESSGNEMVAFGLLVLAWLIPGAGHYCLGKRFRAAFFCATICGMLLLGLVFGQYTVISARAHPLALVLQIFAGLPTVLTAWLLTPTTLDMASPYVDLGMAMTLIAGALNAILIADVYYRATLKEGDAA